MRHTPEKEYSVTLSILCVAIKERRCGGLYIPFANPAAQILCTAFIRTGGAWVPTLLLFYCRQKALATHAATPFQRQRPQKV